MWNILQRDPRVFLWALLLHVGLAILLFSGIHWIPREQALGADEEQQSVEARLLLSSQQQDRVAELRDPEAFRAAQEAERQRQAAERRQMAEAARRAAAEAERQRQEALEAQRQRELQAKREAEEREVRRQAAAEAKRQAEQQARLEAERVARRQAERKAQQQAEREAQQQAEREAKERAQREREAEQQAQREAEERAQREAKAQAEREAEQQAQREAAAAAADAARVQRLASEWVPKIEHRVKQVWVRPQGLRVQVATLVSLKLNPGGEVVPGSVKVIESSGYPAFDTSVVRAIVDASPLPVPEGEDFELFREFNFRFRP
ncbi:cell envelope integrity protein TolA [Rhabdochromatium marinum]|uniref:cell envelope integrity protein TolA n=1 Tax=Rhabdochromatium marinum TaxID=48729 RepID=UPI001903C4BD|nr:cell envelope integrity protein TolA [Rhabdochromatium marinum]MBK1647135.1 protein TolA [Rhabdochromatium marinum]